MKTVIILTQKELKEIEKDRKILAELRSQGFKTKVELLREVSLKLLKERKNLNHDIIIHEEDKIALKRRFDYVSEQQKKIKNNWIKLDMAKTIFTNKLSRLPFFVKWFINMKEYEEI